LAATRLFRHMSRIFQANSQPPSNPGGIRIDSKRRRRLQEKRKSCIIYAKTIALAIIGNTIKTKSVV